MLRNNQFSCRIEVAERGERAVLAYCGLPARPVILPLSGIDLAPEGEGGRFFTATMSNDAAKEYGLTL